MENTPEELLRELGENVEAVGRMMRRSKPFTLPELASLNDALISAAQTVQDIRVLMTIREVE